MVKVVLLSSVVFLLLASCGAQRNLSTEVYANAGKSTVKKVLIIGAGSAASRVFMDNFSKSMAGLLNEKGVAAQYIFREYVKPGTQFDRRALDSLDYDAYIVLYPINTADLTMNREGRIPIWNGFSVKGYAPNIYKQAFSVQAYLKTDKTKPVWEARLPVDLDPIEKEQYNDICYYIFNYLPLD
jgi:hypothetical protein